MNQYIWWFFVFCLSFSSGRYIKKAKNIPPPAKHGYDPQIIQQDEIEAEIDAWEPDDGTYVWEHSGLFEGDIMLDRLKNSVKNGLLSETTKWPNATVPYYIDEDFSEDDTIAVLKAMQEYHDKTCIRFRPYVTGDENWINVKQEYSGCWSSVGMKSEGQIVNLGSVKCRQHGVIIHELMHAIGFYHQQSTFDRDEYILIHWDNIRRGREHNFNKYNESVVTSYDVPYDYESVMHYSAKAFSRNGNVTIEPIHEYTNLGQRAGFSEKDVLKVNSMYNPSCNNESYNILELHLLMLQNQPVKPVIQESYIDLLFQWFESILSLDYWIKRR